MNKQKCIKQGMDCLLCLRYGIDCPMKPNKQKTDWETRFDKTFLNIRFDTTVGTSVNIKDFISQLLKTQREEIISEIIDLVKENREGTFTDDGGNDCWYIDDLVKELKILENK